MDVDLNIAANLTYSQGEHDQQRLKHVLRGSITLCP